jgi:hypothetical protein
MYSSDLPIQHRFGSDGLHLGVGQPLGGHNRTTDIGKVSSCESSSGVNSSDMSTNYLSNRIVVELHDDYSSNIMVVG